MFMVLCLEERNVSECDEAGISNYPHLFGCTVCYSIIRRMVYAECLFTRSVCLHKKMGKYPNIWECHKAICDLTMSYI